MLNKTISDAASEFAERAPRVRARVGVTALFFANGLAIGAWAVAIPQIKALFSLSAGGLSLILFMIGAGAIAAMPVAGLLPPRMGGTGRTLRVSGPVSAVILAALPAMRAAPSPALALAVCAFLFGFANILVDVPMNAHASVVERAWGRAIMSSFHAAWSAGGLIGGAIGGLLISAGASPLVQLGVEGALCFLIAGVGSLRIGAGDRHAHRAAFALPHGRLIALAMIALLAVFAEMSVTDWSALYLRSELGSSAVVASAGYSAYAFMMFLGRALGDAFVRRHGSVLVIVAGAAIVVAGAGLAVAVASSCGGDPRLLHDWPRRREHGARGVQRQRARRSHAVHGRGHVRVDGLCGRPDLPSAVRSGRFRLEPEGGVRHGDRGCARDHRPGGGEKDGLTLLATTFRSSASTRARIATFRTGTSKSSASRSALATP